MNLQKIKQQISKSIDRFLNFAEDKKKEKWVINHQYAQIVFIVKRSITSMKDKKDNDHHCKEYGCKCIQYFEQ